MNPRPNQITECTDERLLCEKAPTCHFKSMRFEFADDGCQQVEYWLCEFCGHTKEVSRYLAG